MHLELVDVLRCPSPHEETWLVAAVTRFDGRDIAEGMLGCPICQRQFPVRMGEVDFSGDASREAPSPAESARRAPPTPEGDPDTRGDAGSSPAPGAEEVVLRARALLGLDEGGGTVLVGGTLALHAEPLADAVAVMPLLLNAPLARSAGVRPPSAIRTVDGVPLAVGSLRAAWLDEGTAAAPWLEGVVRALRPGARLVAPAGAAVPEGVRELARDAREWVGERDAAVAAPSAPVALRRRPGGRRDR